MAQAIRFYADEHIAGAVIRGLRNRGMDVMTVYDAGLAGATDEVHLVRALEERRVLITQDDDYLVLHARGVRHAGITFAQPYTPVGVMVDGLTLVWEVLEPEDMLDYVEYL